MEISIKLPKIAIILLNISILFSCNNIIPENPHPTVEIRYHEGKAKLYRHGEPYFIKGAGGTEHLDKLAEYGGNSVRTWNLQNADSILDKAHELGMTVTLGLEIGRPHWGNDFSYWKFWEVNKKIEELRPIIEKYKDHPALLMWGVGNEVKEYGGSDRFVVFYILEKVAKMIKEVDPNHPTMTAVDVTILKERMALYKFIMPSIDILAFNAFRSINRMSDNVYGKYRWNKAYIISEWGSYGHWEISSTEWGAPKEMKDTEKRYALEQSWNTIQNDSALSLGSYAFYWGFKHEATHTWFSLFSVEGHETPSAQFLKYAWSGQNVDNFSPFVNEISIENTQGFVRDNLYLESDRIYNAVANAEDPEGDTIVYKWEIRQEENYTLGKNFSSSIDSLILEEPKERIQFKTPKDEGPYRIFVYAFDGHGNMSSYNIPFYVIMK